MSLRYMTTAGMDVKMCSHHLLESARDRAEAQRHACIVKDPHVSHKGGKAVAVRAQRDLQVALAKVKLEEDH